MRRHLPLLARFAALALLAGCSNRERLNPLDPGNPSTRGAPQGFVALAESHGVLLLWQPTGSASVRGYRISRRAGAGSFESIADLAAGADNYLDSGLTNGVDYTYHIAFLLLEGGVGLPAEDVATPGPALPWVVEYGRGSLDRLTADGRRVAERITGPFEGPADLDVDPVSGRVWVCDQLAGTLVIVPAGGGAPFVVSGLLEPVSVAVNPVNELAWVCDDLLGAVRSYDPAEPSTPRADVRGLKSPLSVAVTPLDGSVWVCERAGDRVRHIAGNGVPLDVSYVLAPSRVAVDSTTRRVWVTSYERGQLTLLTASGAPADSVTGLGGPIGVAVDPRAGRIWVVDSGANRVLVYDRDLVEVERFVNLPAPQEVAVERSTGEAWVTLPRRNEVVRLSPTGAVIRRLGGFAEPYDVAVITRP